MLDISELHTVLTINDVLMVQAKLRWELDSLIGPLMGFSLDFIFILGGKTLGND